jgi:Phage tail assembly chaperone protein, TAC
MMSSAMGILKWPPAAFWAATVYEYTAAMKGYVRSEGAEVEPGMTRSEFLALKREEERKRKAKMSAAA